MPSVQREPLGKDSSGPAALGPASFSLPGEGVAPSPNQGVRLAAAFNHLQNRPSRTSRCLRIAGEHGQRQAEHQFVQFVDVHGQRHSDVAAGQAVLA